MPDSVRIVPLGGMDEVGDRNCYAIVYGKDAILFDCGERVPNGQISESEMGPEYFPSFDILFGYDVRLRAVLISHAHLDHVGGLPELWERFLQHQALNDVPVVGSVFAKQVIERMIFQDFCPLRFSHKERDTFGPFKVEMFPVVHSTPGSRGFSVHVGGKHIVYLGDCKLCNKAPRRMQEEEAFLHRLRALGKERVDAVLLDSTNADKKGHTPLECDVLANISRVMEKHPLSRIVVSTFSSHTDRLEHIVQIARASGHSRPVFVAGSNMQRYLHIAGIDSWKRYAKDKKTEIFPSVPGSGIILATGAQAEPGSALRRFADGDLPFGVNPARDILISASSTIPKPGIAERVEDMMEALSDMFCNMYLAPNVRTREEYPNVERGLYHASGHASQEDLREILAQISPRLVIPVHAERERRELITPLMPPRSALYIAEEGYEISL